MRPISFCIAAVSVLFSLPLWAETADLTASATAPFAAGTHGEPFTVEALLQGCGESEVGFACTFYAEGARWIAVKDGPSNPAAMNLLTTLPVNAPLIIAGDMVSFGDITVDAVIATATPAEPDAYATLRALSQGAWVDSTDPKSALQITGSEETSIYDGENLGTAVVSFAETCPGMDSADGPVVIKQTMGEDPMDLPCFAILSLTADRMDLSYVGRGNTLTYLRP